MTISMTIIMLETAGNMTYLLPLMVTFATARYTGSSSFTPMVIASGQIFICE